MQCEIMCDEEYMREALAEARLAASEGEVPIGAVVVCGGKIIARSHNRRESDKDPSGHAEFSAMLAASQALDRWRLTGCTVYVTLEPCLMCAGLMVNARVDRCVYGAADPKGGALGTLFDVSADARLNHSFEVTAGVLADECADELTSFFAKLRRGEGGGSQGPDAPAASARPRAQRPVARPAVRAASAPHVLLALDSFKGSASSAEAEAWLAEGIIRANPEAVVDCLPVADGGEGMLDALAAALGASLRPVEVTGPVSGKVTATLALAAAPALPGVEGPVAIIEMAQAAGLAHSPCTREAALRASTFGVGEMMLAAIAAGARTLVVGMGGSATVDGGAGMLRALGARLLDAAGRPVVPGLRGLRDVATIDLAPAREVLRGVEVIALSDVDNPLVGPRGAVQVFGPQKGLCAVSGAGVECGDLGVRAALRTCDRWMAAYGARLTEARDALDGTERQVGEARRRPRSIAGVPGAGAAGGMGAALLALGAKLVPGSDAVLDLLGFDERLSRAEIVVTGEGRLDGQTAGGKVPAGVARRVKALRPEVPVVALCGARADELDGVYAAGIDVALPIGREPRPLSEAMDRTTMRADLVCMGETIVRMLALRG